MTRTLVFVAVLVMTGLFALMNWPAFTAPATLSLGVRTFEAPLGLILLGVIAVLCIGFTAWALTMQATLLRDSRRQSRELQAQRELADRAEASRFTELRAFVAAELERNAVEANAAHTALIARLAEMEARSHRSFELNENAIAAHIGVLDDRLARATAGEPATKPSLRAYG